MRTNIHKNIFKVWDSLLYFHKLVQKIGLFILAFSASSWTMIKCVRLKHLCMKNKPYRSLSWTLCTILWQNRLFQTLLNWLANFQAPLQHVGLWAICFLSQILVSWNWITHNFVIMGGAKQKQKFQCCHFNSNCSQAMQWWILQCFNINFQHSNISH